MLIKNISPMFWPRIFALGMLLLGFVSTRGFAQLVKDGSFEAVTGNGTSGWYFCQGEPDIQILDGYGTGIFGIHTPAANGERYLGMVDASYEVHEVIGQSLNMEAGMHFYGSVALFRSMAHQSWNGTGQLQIWGSNDCSQRQELLWSSGTVDNVDEWAYYPIEFTPTQNFRWISVLVELDAGSGEMTYLCIDDLFLDNEFLAVDYLSLVAQPQGVQVQLTWETAPLVNAERFVVEWGTDGNGFTAIGQVDGVMGETQFSFAHSPLQGGLQYYRLKALDQSGHATLSEVRQAYWTAEGGLQAYPNPAQNRVWVSGHAPLRSIRLFDMNGRLLQALDVDGVEFVEVRLPENLDNGCYHLQIQTSKGMQSTRLIVQH